MAGLARRGRVEAVPTSVARPPGRRAGGLRRAPGEEVELSIVIPTLDATSERLRRCVAALHNTTDVAHEIVVVDNGAPPQGFTAPVNSGLRAARGRLLRRDERRRRDARRLVAAAARGAVATVGARGRGVPADGRRRRAAGLRRVVLRDLPRHARALRRRARRVLRSRARRLVPGHRPARAPAQARAARRSTCRRRASATGCRRPSPATTGRCARGSRSRSPATASPSSASTAATSPGPLGRPGVQSAQPPAGRSRITGCRQQ